MLTLVVAWVKDSRWARRRGKSPEWLVQGSREIMGAGGGGGEDWRVWVFVGQAEWGLDVKVSWRKEMWGWLPVYKGFCIPFTALSPDPPLNPSSPPSCHPLSTHVQQKWCETKGRPLLSALESGQTSTPRERKTKRNSTDHGTKTTGKELNHAACDKVASHSYRPLMTALINIHSFWQLHLKQEFITQILT